MAKAKVLDNKIVIRSEILTDTNIKKAELLAPSILRLTDEETGNTLYEVAMNEYNVFNINGAVFHEGKTVGSISESIMSLPKEEMEEEVKNLLTAVLIRVNAIEEQMNLFIKEASKIKPEIEFIEA